MTECMKRFNDWYMAEGRDIETGEAWEIWQHSWISAGGFVFSGVIGKG